jgi:CHAT domain-containing protein
MKFSYIIYFLAILTLSAISDCMNGQDTNAGRNGEGGSGIASTNGTYQQKKQTEEGKKIYSDLKRSLTEEKYGESRKYADTLEKIIGKTQGITKDDLAASLYYIGLSYSLNYMELRSFSYFNRAISVLGDDTTNQLLGNVYYNLGYSYNKIDDHINSARYFLKSVQYTVKKSGENSSELIKDYISLAISSINTRNYQKSIEYSNKALDIARSKPDSVDRESLANIFQNKGVALINISDHSQGLLNLNRALQIYNEMPNKLNENYINLINNIAATYFYLGNMDKCLEIYEKDLKEITHFKTFTAFGLIKNYSIILAENKMPQRGEKLFAAAVEKVRVNYRESPNKYYDALSSYAGYLRKYRIDPVKAMNLYYKCYDYIRSHPWSVDLNNEISLGYAYSLLDNNKPLIALDSVCAILYRGTSEGIPADKLQNPDLSELRTDSKTLDILQVKFEILDKLAATGKDTTLLIYRAKTAGLLIDLLETIRLNIGEEQSRLLLGDRYRDAYFDAIRSFKSCYDITHRMDYLEKAFEISERSKAASLLASMREIHAMKAAIPMEKMMEERELQKEISFYESKYEEEKNLDKPDTGKLNFWERNLLSTVERKNLLVRSFEEKYPDYSSIKSSRIVSKPADVLKVTGRNKDYLSYVITDTTLYIFLVNRNGTKLTTVRTDSSFLALISDFRRLLSEPDLKGSARKEFNLFQEYGYRLYSYLIMPVTDHLVSDELIISTDNLLSYFPFEALVTDSTVRKDLYYSRLPYLMNKFRISYVYSATLLSESGKAGASLTNSSLSFAPSYNRPILVDSLFVNRQQSGGYLPDLKFAREEAEYVARLTSGKLFLDSSATKSNYLAQAGKYDIIHLAMHTVINGKNPVNSGMIFSSADSANGIYLQPYEVYSVELHSKMVVLSSCFTGMGTLYAGEGVLSIARGFIFSGSHSVVMSLWEINDHSGTDIMKEFYRNLKSGKSKSEALREARISYLKKADMLRAHPYFWSTLVIYGDDSPIYRPLWLRLAVVAVLPVLMILAFIYFRKRWYSR